MKIFPTTVHASCFAATVTAFATLLQPAHASDYPTKPINMVVASAPGGILDTIGRIVAKGVEKLGQPVVVQNIPGGGSSIGTAAVTRAPADGYTLGMVATSHAINPSVYKKLPYDTLRDFATVSHVVNLTNALVVSNNTPASTLQEFIELAKKSPGQLNCGSAGNGQSNHLSLESFNTEAGVKLSHIPYKGSSLALNDVLGGTLSCMFVDVLSIKQQVSAGKLKALAVSGKNRVTELPDVPTFAEAGLPSFDANSWLALVVRAGTPKDITEKLGHAIAETMREPEVNKRLLSMGVVPVGAPPTESQDFMKREISRYATVVEKAGIKNE